MSLKTWTDEFYPKRPSKRMSKITAIRHSLLKWTGLLPENLRKHGLKKNRKSIQEIGDGHDWFIIGGDSCALCVKYANENDHPVRSVCENCPLYKNLNDTPCDEKDENPYFVWAIRGDPKPMIKALKETLKANGG